MRPHEELARFACGLRLAASKPKTIAPIIKGYCLLCCDSKRAMWRWVTWLNSWASTDANSSRLEDTPIRPK